MKRINQKGFSLVELIIATGLVALALYMIYSFTFASINFSNHTSKRVDQQAQLRVIMLGLKEELKTAAEGSVRLLDDSEVTLGEAYLSGLLGVGEYLFYIAAEDPAVGNQFWRIDGPSENRRIAFIDFELPDLKIEFNVFENNPKLIHVKLESEGVVVEGNLALLNEVLNTSDDSESDYVEPYDLSGDPYPYYGIILKQATL